MKSPLIVKMWGQEIGRLNWDFRRKTFYFQFNTEFLTAGLDPFPLIAPIAHQSRLSTHFGEEERMYQRLPAFIADSLPDAWGNHLLDLWRKEQGLALGEITPLEQLAFIGKRAMGALEYEPALTDGFTLDKVNVASLAQLAERIVTEREKLHLLPDDDITIKSLIQVGTSAGGMRPKAIIAIHKETGEIRSGQIGGLDEYDYFILKFGDQERQTAELEMTYYEMALEAGITMSECRLWKVDGITHFLTKRFDRVQGEKVHMQTISALMPEANSYDHLLQVCRRLQLPQEASDEMFRRMVFNILANNTDDHKKNFSFLMDKTGKWSLSPAYDLTYIFDVRGFMPSLQHCFYTAGKNCNYTLEDILDFARMNDIRNPEGILRRVAAAVERFPELAAKNGVRPEWIGRIWATLQDLLHQWHLIQLPNESPYRIEQTYKGNYHLYVHQPDHRERRYVIRPKMPEFAIIEQLGINGVSDEQIAEWLKQFN